MEVVVGQQQLFSASLIDSFSVVFLREENWCTALQLGHFGNYPHSISPQLLNCSKRSGFWGARLECYITLQCCSHPSCPVFGYSGCAFSLLPGT